MKFPPFTSHFFVRIVLVTFLMSGSNAFSQYCDSITPSFDVDLSSAPYMTWVSPDTDRDGYCCGASAPDKCLEFIITLNPNAAAIVFNIASGAVPPGALFYQIDCGPPTPVGSPICLIGTGPFHLTFCKPGNNTNTFSIETIPNPIFGPNISLGDGCSGLLGVQFYDETTVTWNSISPGAAGTYNGALSCAASCDTTAVLNSGNLPAQIEYLVCGLAQNGCTLDPVCDTLIVTLASTVIVSINAPDTVLCADEVSVPATAVISGGTPPYNVTWSNGANTLTTNLPAGAHSVSVTDATGCVIHSANTTITQLPPLNVNAGGDVNSCANYIGAITLNGSSNASSVIWSGGNGTYTPSNSVLNPDYTPTPVEVQNGSVELILTTNDTTGCPNLTDNMSIAFNEVSQSVVINTTNITCNGLTNGTATVTVTGPQGPFTYSFDGGAYTTTNTIGGLSSGNHTVSIMSSLGCDSILNYLITEPAPLIVAETDHSNVSCAGGSDGEIAVQPNGGTPSYSYAWNTTPVQNTATAVNLSSGSYTVTATDANGCSSQLTVPISQPTPLAIQFNTVEPSCNGYANGAISSTISGGVGSYTYSWNTGSSATSVYNVNAGNYSLTVTDENGCTANAAQLVNEPPLLVVSTNADTIVCPGTPQNITAMASGGSGTYSYIWDPTAGNQSSINVSPTSVTTYTCTVQDNNGCSATDQTVISVFSLNPNDLQASISTDSICLHDDVNLFGQYIGTDNSVVLSWDFCPTCPINTTDTPMQTTTYTLTAINQCNETISTSVAVVVVPPPSIDLSPTQTSICQGEYFSVHSTAVNDTTWNYFWDFGDGGISHDMVGIHSYENPGTYTITVYVQNGFGCMSDSTASTTITVNPEAIANFTPSSYVETTLDPLFTFFNTSSYTDSYSWSFGDGATSTNTSPTHLYDTYGVFTVTLNANNNYNCPDQYQTTIEIKPSFDIYIPNAFTPDGDANNQIFLVQGFGLQEDGFELEIYNRWGELIYYSKDIHAGWDGTYKTETVQDGVYVWVVRFKDLTDKRHEKNGHVSLLR